jgi:hypothetical protein
MPLLDHFHPPLSEERRWESFHAAWAGSLADDLNRRLPAGYFAEEETHAGPGVEVDVATWEQTVGVSQGGTAVAAPPQVWAPPAAAATIPAVFSDDFEVRVLSRRGGPRLVAAIELVGPRNKDRADARQAFGVKCASYLHQGVSVLIVDIVTDRLANLHHQVLALLRAGGLTLLPSEGLYAVAHRPVRRGEQEQIDLWPAALQVGQPLPTLPLWISAELCLPIDLEAAYMDVRRRRRL